MAKSAPKERALLATVRTSRLVSSRPSPSPPGGTAPVADWAHPAIKAAGEAVSAAGHAAKTGDMEESQHTKMSDTKNVRNIENILE